jgi:FtsH-binding integral membrane protein
MQNPEMMMNLFHSPLIYVAMFAPFGVVLFLSLRISRMQASTAQLLFWVYAGLMGISMSFILSMYTTASVANIFFITASVFGSMSIYGYTTKKDLTSMGSFLIMGVWGLILASLINMFMHSSAFQMMISMVTVLIFTGLTAYDTQNIKEVYLSSDSTEVASKKAIIGALQLYIDFINIFISLLRLFGDRR